MWIPLTSLTFSDEEWVNFVRRVYTLKFHQRSFGINGVISSIELEDPVHTTNRKELPTVSHGIVIVDWPTLALQIQQQ
jgi:hypothetical protein